ncbi:uncharacterized protein F4822DRAFT_374462 [Hypoxylon trugodes]|uniref:uncharacterized protein n=1 Tax=Hypoxylon trugodes TaxID=326681 RepID=UPI002197249E|nr:uncharacterized protein F4822DRAFT_374462 [Hypoxylon trugodes]KAI1384831.1 hypothetical protein F4822DRAFT_374462 [Hypoxylon trugodes]
MVGVAGRSKGCNTCRKRRVKCDEAKPKCHRCLKAGFECLGYERATQWRHTSVAPTSKSRPHSPEFMELISPTPMGLAPAPELSLVAFEGDMCTAYVFKNFVWKSYGSLWLDHAAEGKLDTLSLDAVKALSRLSFGLGNKVQDLQHKGESQYGRCLRVLADELGRDEVAAHDSRRLIVPILVLMMVSAIQADRTAAGFHLRAIEKVLILCGPGAFQQQPLRNAFEAARATLLVSSLLSRRRTFLENPCWHFVPYALDSSTKPQQSQLLDIFVTIPGFLEEESRINDSNSQSDDESIGLSLILDEQLDRRAALGGCVAAQLEKLYRWRWNWQRKYSQYVAIGRDEWQRDSLSPKSTDSIGSSRETSRLRFDRPIHSNDIMLYNAVLMWLMTLMWKLQPFQAASRIQCCARRAAASSASPPNSPGSSQSVSFEPLSWPGAFLSIRDPALEICRAFEWQCRHYEQHTAFSDQTCLLLLPLGMARCAFDGDSEYQDWIDNMLDSNPVTAGYGRGGGSVVGFGSYITPRALDPNARVPDDNF